MSAAAALLYGAGAWLLVLGGALKVVDPSGSVGAARALGLSASGAAVRGLAVVELVLGGVALATTEPVVAVLVAASYVGFATFTVLALARRTPIDSCGCLGGMETPPSWRHLVVVGLAAAGAIGTAIAPGPSFVERLGDGASGAPYALATLALTGAAVVALRAGRRPIGAR